MQLLASDSLRVALGEMDFPDVLQLISTALGLITPVFEEIIGTRFKYRVGNRDVFNLGIYIPGKDITVTKLKLSQGFVDEAASIEVRVSSYLSDLDNAALFTDWVLDYERGLLVFPNGRPDSWVAVLYSAGLTKTADVYTPIPEWLYQAALVYGTLVYQRLILEKNRDKEKALKCDSLLTTPPEIRFFLNDHVRWFPQAYDVKYTLI